MGNSTKSPTPTSRTRGKIGPVVFVAGAWTGTLLALVVLIYLLVMFTAIRVVPMTMGFVKAGTGVTASTPWDTIVMVWIAPSLVLVAIAVVGLVFLIRWLWAVRSRLMLSVRRWAFGVDEASAPVVTAVSIKRAAATRNRQTKSA